MVRCTLGSLLMTHCCDQAVVCNKIPILYKINDVSNQYVSQRAGYISYTRKQFQLDGLHHMDISAWTISYEMMTRNSCGHSSSML